MSVEAPERIWVSPNDAYELPWEHASASPDDFNEDGVEYVRADKLEELAAENEKWRPPMPSEKQIEAIRTVLWHVAMDEDGEGALEEILKIIAAEQAQETLPVAYTTQKHLDKVRDGHGGIIWNDPMPHHPDIPLYTSPQPDSRLRGIKWEQLVEVINAAIKVAVRTGKAQHFDVDKLREFCSEQKSTDNSRA